jgi:hypothetical protein
MRKNSGYLKIRNEGSCEKGIQEGHIDCLQGCSHPSILDLIFRIIILPFYFRPIVGYGKIVDDKLEIDDCYVEMPGISAAEAFNIKADAINKAGNVIYSAFKKSNKEKK